jgi:hypothetical protein
MYNNSKKFFNPKKIIYSAGILPYKVSEDNKVYVLLGKDNQGTWSDFGGRSEIKDNNNIMETASREFFEESLNSVIDLHTTRKMLKNENNYELVKSKTLNGSPYYMFVLRLPMRPELVRNKFKSTYEMLRYADAENKWLEKNDVMWVSLDTISYCLEDISHEYELGWPLRKVFRDTLNFSKDILLKLKYKDN